MNKKTRRRCFLFALITLLFSTLHTAAQIEDFITGTSLNFLTLRGGNLYYKADCGQSGLGPSRIRQRPANGDASVTLYVPSVCDTTSYIVSELGADNAYLYWLNGNGNVRRMRSYGGYTPVTIATTPAPGEISVNGQITVGSSYVYWTEEKSEFRDRSIIYRVLKTGGTPEIVFDYSADNNQWVRSMEALGDDRLIFLLSDGRVIDGRLTLIGSPPFQFYAWTRATVSLEATAMFLTSSRLFRADRSSDGRSIFFRSAPLTAVTNITLHHAAFRSTAHDVFEFVTDSTNLFYQDLTAPSLGPLMRKSLTDATAAVEIGTLTYRASHMVLTDRHVIWRKNDTTISRLPINAAAVTRDLAATALEVVQVIQNTNNQSPLVMGKPTFVRLFGHILNSSAGETVLNFWPSAYLHGEKSGVPLPGSPLTPYRSSPLATLAGSRTNLGDGFWFHLPDSWTRQGAVTLRGMINPNRSISETSFANNTRTFTANFVPKVSIAMVMKPTRTRLGIIRYFHPNMQQMFDYIEALLPTSEMRVVWGGGVIEEPYDPFHWIGDGGPFEVNRSDDDGCTMLIELNTRKVFTTERFSEASGGFDHYVAMLKFQQVNDPPRPSDRPWSGFAQLGDYNIGRVANPSAFFQIGELSGIGVRRDVTTVCQELAHNYGRGHVDCGGPTQVDDGYPYDTDKLYSPGFDYLGFDPFQRRLILPTMAMDYMSYCAPKWTSDYTWRALFNRFSTAARPAVEAEVSAADVVPPNMVLIQGFFDEHHGTAGFKQALPIAGEAEWATAQALIEGQVADARYQLHAYADGELKFKYPTFLQDLPADEGARAISIVIALAEVEPGFSNIDFVDTQNNVVVRSLLGGGAPPAVTVLAPEAGSNLLRTNSLFIQWEASDPDDDPLVFTVRFSRDGGTNWQVLASGTPETQITLDTTGIPGSKQCVVQVIASDGILTGTAQSGLFSLESGIPQPFIFVETSRGKNSSGLTHVFAHAGEQLTLHGRAFDDEDGEVDAIGLFWDITGPLNRAGNGRQFTSDELPPGNYTVTLNATDSDKNVGHEQITLTIDPHYVENAGMPITLDGFADDAGYLKDTQPLPIRYNTNSPALVRTVHHDGKLYVAVSGLRTGNDPNSWVGISVDTDNSGGATGGGDFRFDVFRDGRIRTMTGNGFFFIQDEAPNGLSANISVYGSFWTAELEIDIARLGGWNGQTIGLAVGHYHIDTSGEVNRYWPVNTAENGPATWGDVVLGTNPNNPEDKDYDGLPDQWENTYFDDIKSQTAFGDPDKDEKNNLEEFISGTDPMESNSIFKVQISDLGDGVQLSWPAADGRTYVVYRSDDLSNWEPITFGLSSGDWFDAGRNTETSFYRVEVSYGRYAHVFE